MSPADYQRERKLRGTQVEVAAALDIPRETLSRRELRESQQAAMKSALNQALPLCFAAITLAVSYMALVNAILSR